MGQFFILMRQRAGAVVAGLVCLMAIAGIGIFILAFQECRFAPPAGATWQYQLNTEIYEIEEDGEIGARRYQILHDLDMLCMGSDNDVALISSYKKNGRTLEEEINHLHISPKGQVSRYQQDELLNNSGQLIGHFFDFNLFPLPEGLEQSWTVPMVYSILPADKNQVIANVKRIRNGSRPKFLLTFPPVAWYNKNPSDPYSQISNFRCVYTFDIARGVVEEADISFVFARERPRPQNIQQVQVQMNLDLQDWSQFEDPIALRDTALKGIEIQDAINNKHSDRLNVLIQRLQASPKMPYAIEKYLQTIRKKNPQHLRTSHNRQSTDERPRNPEPERSQVETQANGRYALQIASIGKDKRAAAEREVSKLKRQGFKAFLGEKGQYYIICIGPYAEKSQAVINEFKQRYPANGPFWVTLTR